MIKVTDYAKKNIQRFQEEGNCYDKFLRINVQKGGCNGLKYNIDFDNTIQDDDYELIDNDMKLVIKKSSLLYVAGMTLDYKSGLNGRGFEFINPNASTTCKCGESFSM